MKSLTCITVVVLTACNAYPAERTEVGEFSRFTTIVDFEHENTDIVLTADDMAQLAYIVTDSWRNHPDVSFPSRMETCVQATYHIVADEKSAKHLCNNVGNGACNYPSNRNFRLTQRYDSPYESVSVYDEAELFECTNAVWVVLHEYLHKMVECYQDHAVRDEGDRNHSNENVWHSWTGVMGHAYDRAIVDVCEVY